MPISAKLKEWGRLVGFVGGFYVLVTTLLFAGFYVPSESMLPTLTVGDQFYAAKYAYGYSRFSTPFVPLPFGSGRIPDIRPERGDVIVFRKGKDETDLVKRVIGLPGDRLQWREGRLYINGEMVERERVRDYVYRTHNGVSVQATEYRETLPGGRQHLILEQTDSGFADNTAEYVVPEDHIFVSGDNRDNSGDSRFLNDVGYVPLERVLGRVSVVAFTRAPCAAEDGLVCPGGGFLDRLLRRVP